jgi:hypothetical protein
MTAKGEPPSLMQKLPAPDAVEAAVRTATGSAGVEFITENGGGAGVRLQKG